MSDEPETTPAEARQMKQLKARIRWHDGLMKMGNYAAAAAYAQKYQLPPSMLGTANPETKEVEPAPVMKPKAKGEPITNEELINGWPKNSTGVIINDCPNPRLQVILLRDGRTSSVWKSGFAVRAKVNVVLDKSTGDPIYRITGAI